VGLAVVQELVWVLTSIYKANRSDVLDFLEKLLSLNEIMVEQADVVRQATRIYGATKVSFSDCLIVASASAVGCTQTLTFDRQAAKYAGMTLVQ
jgi:predicted nucleic-acid-binding protein